MSPSGDVEPLIDQIPTKPSSCCLGWGNLCLSCPMLPCLSLVKTYHLLLPVRLGLRFRRLTNFFRILSFPCLQTLTCSNLEEDTLNVDPTRRQSLRPAKTRQVSSGFFVKYQLVTRKDQAIIFCQTSLSFLTNKKIYVFFAGRTENTTARRVTHSRKVLR